MLQFMQAALPSCIPFSTEVVELKRRTVIALLIPAAGIGLFLRFPGPAADGVRAGLRLCGSVLIPALFPVSVLSGCLIRMSVPGGASRQTERVMRRLFALPGQAAAPLLLGLLGGFPLGAQLAATACEEGLLTKQEAARLAGLSTNAGPAFLLGAVSAMLGAPRLGALLLAVQLCSAVLTGFLLRGRSDPLAQIKSRPTNRSASLSTVLPLSISSSAAAMLRLAGAVAFFQSVTACLGAALPLAALPPLLRAGLTGTLELTGGLALLCESAGASALPLAAAMIGWGGLCVHLQAAQALSAAGIPMGPYLRHKAVQAGVSLLLMLLFG